MKCVNHKIREAKDDCVKCSNSFCEDCLVIYEGEPICKNCLEKKGRAYGNYFEDNYSDDRGYLSVLFIILMLFFPIAGIFAGRFKPFSKPINTICQVYGWVTLIITALSLLLLALIILLTFTLI